MNQDSNSFIERYQLIYEKDPKSKVFAPLAEAYRRMGLLDEAIDLAEEGVRNHPHFSSGRVALAKCYAQKGWFEKAIEHFSAAAELSPENILAHRMLAESYIKLKKKNEALQAYKMVLFLNPQDEKIAAVVQKLEKALFEEDSTEDSPKALAQHIRNPSEEFQMHKLQAISSNSSSEGDLFLTENIQPSAPKEEAQVVLAHSEVERELALLDTRFERRQWKEARQHLSELRAKHPLHQGVLERVKKLETAEAGTAFVTTEWLSPMDQKKEEKIQKLQFLLSHINSRRNS